MRQAVTTTLSMWGERRLGYSSLRESTVSLEDERWPPLTGLKENSIIEEKEVEDSKVEVWGGSFSVDAPGAVMREPASFAVDLHSTGLEQSKNLSLEIETQTRPITLPQSVTESVSTCGNNEDGETSRPQTPINIESNRQAAGPDLHLKSSIQCKSIGDVAPHWVPDSQAPVCMKCGIRFTFTKRRHHCRACGKVFCVVCCDLRFRLSHLDGKEGRVCVTCHSTLMNKSLPKEHRRVWFADSVLPDTESTDTNTSTHKPARPSRKLQKAAAHEEMLNSPDVVSGAVVSSPVSNSTIHLSPEGLPPILTSTGIKGDFMVIERPSETSLMEELEGGRADPLVFVLNANLLAMVKVINYVNRKCWCVTSKGMHAMGQAEVVVLLQCLPEEKTFPRDIFSHFLQLYRDAQTGKTIDHLSHSVVTCSFLGSKEHTGFLYVQSTFQSLEGLPLPSQPFLFGLLILRDEMPWAKAFPLRLMLRLGAEYRFYPCPLFSVRFRKPVFGDISNTIMKLLVDFRLYRYTLPVVPGLMVDMEARSTCVKIPKSRHNELMKALKRSNEKVLALGACFNERADSHLICVQTADGQYQTQAISIHNQPRRVTGSCFFVFSGVLKASPGYLAKSSIVEDGLMVQITMETMAELRRSLREMKDFTITCGKIDQSDRQEQVHIEWLEEDPPLNKGIISPIDGRTMESVSSLRSHQRSEYRANGKIIRWSEVFFLRRDQQANNPSNHSNYSHLTERLAWAFCLALCRDLRLLKEDGMAKLALRVTLDSQKANYQAGSNGQPLPAQYRESLDRSLTPVLQSSSYQKGKGVLELELIFYILEDVS
ncbi:zinc finger FYVE domain-containing protein 9 [Chanos chanos]|uniref:Zinc finger FYVE domain-containing protein 9 n=1 Tax=Chanos chanos TaxID=29144 RepID=A0A6J2WTZ1_CHACN|nr:zinc finger FYVE domain-containing protein 9-like [Chanos chanos]